MSEAELLEILKKNWGYNQFRPLQLSIIQSVLEGKDTLAILPTGGGKSLCYQVSALAQRGICLVVSPLIALMKDQVEALTAKGIPALLLHTGLSRRMMVQILKNAAGDHYKFLYCSPERLQTELFLEYLPALQVNLIAVDEAHCISQWGFDFRPAYRQIATLRTELPDVPVLALTASATRKVKDDICDQLQFGNSSAQFVASFDRPNLSYSVFNAEAKLAKLVSILKSVQGSAIVYCSSRKRTMQIAQLLHMHGLNANFYHAGLPTDERSQRQQLWMQSNKAVMVCTTAFGMGIDKSGVRLVIHADVPDSLESYYQESGRAGRDGVKAYAVLLYNVDDIASLQSLHLQRFPTLQQIKEVYEALVNYLQLPVHSGEEQSFDFYFSHFIKAFKLQPLTSLYALRALEADGWLQVSDKAFAPATLHFTCNRTLLENFLRDHPQHENLLLTILRNYEGVFDFGVAISEKVIASLVNSKDEIVKQSLQQVAAFGIVRYTPQNEAPQVYFKKARVAAKDLLLNEKRYSLLKAAFVQRAEQMLQYLQTTTCRAAFINNYFNSPTAECGVCDNCLEKKKKGVTPQEFDQLAQIVLSTAIAPTTIEALLKKMAVRKEKAWPVIQFLQAENKLTTTKEGLLVAV